MSAFENGTGSTGTGTGTKKVPVKPGQLDVKNLKISTILKIKLIFQAIRVISSILGRIHG
jgi:hypothetical protein